MPELGNINLGSGPNRGMDPIPLIKQQGQQQLSNLDKEWSQKYQQLNKLYDWSRHGKYPDEITRLRDRLERDIAGRRQAVQSGMQQTISKFAMLDHLFPNDPQQANKLKWTAAVGKQVADQMFPQQVDPQVALQRNRATQVRLMDNLDEFAIEGGRLYATERDDKGYPTGEADKSKPATQEQMQTWALSKDALYAKEQEEQEYLSGMSEAGVPDPSYLQGLAMGQRRKGFFGKLAAFGYGISGPGLVHRAYKKGKAMFAPEPNGTFAQKVEQAVTQRPRTGRTLTKKQAMLYLQQHGGDRQAAMAAAAADGYQ